jgi:O-antigen ligase
MKHKPAALFFYPVAGTGLNMFAYCIDNPVNTTDSEGDMPWWVKVLIGLAVIALCVIAVVATGGAGLAGAIAFGALKGAVFGALSGALSGGIIGCIGAAIGGGTYGREC